MECQGYGYSVGGGYNQSPSGFTSSQTEEKNKRAQSLHIVPCTVSQLLSATEAKDAFLVGEIEVTKVKLVGIIRKTAPSVTNILYTVDDMTAPPIDVKEWVDLEDANMESSIILPGTYVKVTGCLHSFQHRRSLVAFNLRRLEDLNEITSHMLEVVQAHMFSGSPPHGSVGDKGTTSSLPNPSHPNVGMVVGYSATSNTPTCGFTPNQNQVFNLIKSCPVEIEGGISVLDLKTKLGYLSILDIKNCLRFLIYEGHIFSTIDDNHFRSTYS